MTRNCDCCGLEQATVWTESVYADGTGFAVLCGDCLAVADWSECVSYRVEGLGN